MHIPFIISWALCHFIALSFDITRLFKRYPILQVYRQDMYGGSHVWILSGPTIYDEWINNVKVDELSCSMEQLIEATQGFFTTGYVRESEPSQITISGQVCFKSGIILDIRQHHNNKKIWGSFKMVRHLPYTILINFCFGSRIVL